MHEEQRTTVIETPESVQAHEAALLRASGWPSLRDRLLLALCHDLNGRAAALRAVSELCAVGEPLPADLGPEADRLALVARRLGLLAAPAQEGRVPIDLEGILGRALDLYGVLTGGEPAGTVAVSTRSSPTVLVAERRSLRTVLLLVDRARSANPPEPPVLTLQAESDRILLRIDPGGVDGSRPPGGPGAPESRHAPPAQNPAAASRPLGAVSARDSLDALAGLDGGGVEVDGGRSVLWLPWVEADAAGDGRPGPLTRTEDEPC